MSELNTRAAWPHLGWRVPRVQRPVLVWGDEEEDVSTLGGGQCLAKGTAGRRFLRVMQGDPCKRAGYSTYGHVWWRVANLLTASCILGRSLLRFGCSGNGREFSVLFRLAKQNKTEMLGSSSPRHRVSFSPGQKGCG